mmetsp:Transcript_5898/g.11000  ORF Transcript_5898/g.11000 Transcript_5898/m.11000 type:complete len:83 (-) Transcript_5898:23-271(-)
MPLPALVCCCHALPNGVLRAPNAKGMAMKNLHFVSSCAGATSGGGGGAPCTSFRHRQRQLQHTKAMELAQQQRHGRMPGSEV